MAVGGRALDAAGAHGRARGVGEGGARGVAPGAVSAAPTVVARPAATGRALAPARRPRAAVQELDADARRAAVGREGGVDRVAGPFSPVRALGSRPDGQADRPTARHSARSALPARSSSAAPSAEAAVAAASEAAVSTEVASAAALAAASAPAATRRPATGAATATITAVTGRQPRRPPLPQAGTVGTARRRGGLGAGDGAPS